MQKKHGILKIFKIDDGDIESALVRMEKDDFHRQFKDHELLKCQRVHYDRNSRFVGCYGD
jgi:hypothetical protein